MRLRNIIFGIWVLAFSTAANASSPWYMGINFKHLKLDDAREASCNCEMSSNQVGVQIGKYISSNLSLEIDHTTLANGSNLDVSSVSSIFWAGNHDSAFRYFALLGFNHFNFDEESAHTNNSNEQSTQIVFGLGVGRKVAEKYQVRADMRWMGGHDENAEDIGFQLSFNRLLGTSTASVQAPVVEPETAQKPKIKTITINLNVEFEFDKANVLAIYSDQLATVAQAMQTHSDIELVLEGHTDSIGSESYNKDLSARRAEAVKAKLSKDYAISSDRISTIGYGESRPIASNDSAEGRALNRRVVGEMNFTEVIVE